MPCLSLVVPVFNEGANIDQLVRRLTSVLDGIGETYEIVFIDDGSADDTLVRVSALARTDARFRVVALSRNFGKDIAIAAGLDHARGDAVVLIDADLQHPPEMIAAFVAKWREGYDMVYGQRIDRATDGPIRRALTHAFYNLFQRFGEIDLPDGAGDFRLMDRKVADAVRRMPERARFSKGLYAWVGFKSIGVPFEVADRAEGASKWSFRKLFRFAFDGITSFSSAPLKVWTFVGLTISIFALFFALYFVIETLFLGSSVPGFPSLIVSVMFFAGVQLMSLGILGEYIGRIFAEVKRRPLYVVAEVVEKQDEPKPLPTPRPPAKPRVRQAKRPAS
ncbi:MAG: glycosyltransferase family 2 protein [Beijerinckiaceae bacterium]|nr:glycosyltransferase family 2 protein [Beijerinckiaceae bacterium]